MLRKLLCVVVVVLAMSAAGASQVEAGRWRSVTRVNVGPNATRVYSRTVARPVAPLYARPVVVAPYAVSYPVTTVTPITVGYTYAPYYYPVVPARIVPAPVIVDYGVYPVVGW